MNCARVFLCLWLWCMVIGDRCMSKIYNRMSNSKRRGHVNFLSSLNDHRVNRFMPMVYGGCLLIEIIRVSLLWEHRPIRIDFIPSLFFVFQFHLLQNLDCRIKTLFE